MHFDSTGDSLKIGDKVSYPYTQYTLHTGVVLKFDSDHTVISVDKEWWGKNGGRVKDGIKHNNIETEKLTKDCTLKNTLKRYTSKPLNSLYKIININPI